MAGSASFNATDATLDELWSEALADAGEKNLTYRKRGGSWFVVSGIGPPGRVFYRRTELRRDVVFSLWLEYPEAEKRRFDPIVESVAELYRVTADGFDVHR